MTETTENSSTKGPELRRRRSRRPSRRRRRPLRQSRLYRNGPEILLLLMAGVGVFFLLNPFPQWVEPSQFAGGVDQWLAYERGSYLIGAGLAALVLVLGVLRLRRRINHRQAWWARGCPRCGSVDLKRSRRTGGDRLLNRLGIPVRRYVCRSCHWYGRRIDESYVP